MVSDVGLVGAIRLRRGLVTDVTREGSPQELTVRVDGLSAGAINYPDLSGVAHVGDEVILNTTAMSLGLGTGGRHFVIHILGSDEMDSPGPGHIMKLRYTPMQVRCLAVEEEDSPWHGVLENADSLEGLPVVVAGLHSMVPAVAAAIRLRQPTARIIYVMTDGASLPMAFSRLVPQMRGAGLIDGCITAGHSFGGDYEAVNVWSALLAARYVARATHCVVAMGPGIVGTGTAYGFTGMEQADILNSVASLSGRPIAALRISFADPRPRHAGVSHHSLTVLGRATLAAAEVAVPAIDAERERLVREQLVENGILQRHRVTWGVDASQALQLVGDVGIHLSTMGRGVDAEREFFLAAAAAGHIAAGGQL